MGRYLPTKSNLLKLNKTILLSKQGYELLEKKRKILIKEREKFILRSKELKEEYLKLYNIAFNYLKTANIEIGIDAVKKIEKEIKIFDLLDIKYKTLMGVEISSVVYEKENQDIVYGLYHTTIALDEVVKSFRNLRYVIIELANVENSLYRLNAAIEKIQTRSNALKEVIIPADEKLKKDIENVLEEKDREEFSRLKIIKNTNLKMWMG